MKKQTFTTWSFAVLVAVGLGLAAGEARAQDTQPSFGQKVFYYFPNLALDVLDIFRVGAAVGPGWGAEVAFTEDHAIGNYKTNEKGIGWYGSSRNRRLVSHKGEYETRVRGSERVESSVDDASRFFRGEKANDEWDVRGQAALGIVHPYVGIDLFEIGDAICGLVGHDLKGDNMNPLAYREGEPARKLGRGISNVATGVLEIPKSIYQVKEGHGDIAGVTWGTFRGIQRCLVREAVGIGEVLTFPTGSKAKIEPEFPFEPQVSESSWRVLTDR